MDISKANTEPFYIFHKFHESLNRLTKAIAGSLVFTQRAIGGGSVGKKMLSALIEGAGEPWRGTNHYAPERELTSATMFFAEMGVVRVASAMEDFVISADAEVSRWTARRSEGKEQRKPLPVTNESDDQAANLLLVKLCKGCGWDLTSYEAFVAVYLFFQRVRNCIVHRNGRITSELARTLEDEEFIKKWKKVSTPRGTQPVPLPAVVDGRLSLLPRHVILFSSVCRKLASAVNGFLLDYVGEDGLLYMAVHHSLLIDAPVEWVQSAKSPEGVINWTLANRFHIKEITAGKTITLLKAAGLWDRCRERYEILAPK